MKESGETESSYTNNVEASQLPTENISETLIENIDKIKTAFLNSNYPLSPTGKTLKQEILADKYTTEELCRLLPTVENPHSFLFADLQIDETNKATLFGPELKIIQTTKGCTHQCKHCAISAHKKVEIMPFQAVIKCAEAKQEQDQRISEMVDLWFTDLERETGHPRIDLVQMKYGMPGVEKFTKEDMEQTGKIVHKIYQTHPFTEIFFRLGLGQKILDIQEHVFTLEGFSREKSETNLLNIPLSRVETESVIYNYFDSDPFDYVDVNFLHEDGTPANYGDVYNIINSNIRHVGVVTAGWSQTNTTNNSVAEKIFKGERRSSSTNPADPKITLSVNKYEPRYERNPDKYREDTLHNIKLLMHFGLTVRLVDEGDDLDWTEKVAAPIKYFIASQENNDPNIHLTLDKFSHISRFSGRLAENGNQNKKDNDVMIHTPGLLIQPDGQVLYQKKSVEYPYHLADKGVRPKVIKGLKLWSTKK